MKSDREHLEYFEKEFHSLLDTVPEETPDPISRRVLKTIRKLLFLSNIGAIASLILIHLFAGTLVIAICPQFGFKITPFNGLINVFMLFGETACMFLCGAFFLSTSILISSLVLPKVFKNYLYRIRYYKVSFLIIISLIFFSIVSTVPLIIPTLSWIIGAFIFGMLSTKTYMVRYSSAR